MSRLTELVSQIKPFVLGWISQAGGGAGPYAPSPHDIGGSHHTGSIADSQFPNALLRDGSRSLLGNLTVADTMTLDGVDLSVFKAAYDIHIGNASAHHNPVTIGTGGLSAKLGLATQVLTLAAIAHGDLSSIDSNQHIDHTTVSISAGTGLSGGGTIAASRSLSHGAGDFGDLHTNYPEHDQIETITAAWTHQADLVTRLLRPELTDTYDIGTSTYWYNQQFVSQINATVFAEQQIVLMGGWLYIPKDAGTFAAEVGSAATTINFGKAMTVGDFVLVKAYDKSATVKTEYIQVGSLVSGTTYNVTRDLAGAHTTDPNWAQGAPYAVLGQSGNGRIELNAYDTPRIQIIQQGATYATQTELARLGDLNGNWGYSAATYGLALGEYASSKANLTWDPTNGLRLRTYSTTVIQLDNAGGASLAGVLNLGASGGIYQGTGSFATPDTGLKIWNDSGMGKLALYNNYAQAVTLDGNGITIASGGVGSTTAYVSLASGGYIGGYSSMYSNYLKLGYWDGGQLLVSHGLEFVGEAYRQEANYFSFTVEDGVAKGFIFSGGALLVGSFATASLVGLASGDVSASNDIRLGGGLVIGSTSTDPGAGEVHYTSHLKPVRSGSTYTGHVYVPLDTPLTHTDWDGDAKSVGSYTQTPASWGYPASAKALFIRILGKWSSANSSYYFGAKRASADSHHAVAVWAAVANTFGDVSGIVTCDSSGQFCMQVGGGNASDVRCLIFGYFL